MFGEIESQKHLLVISFVLKITFTCGKWSSWSEWKDAYDEIELRNRFCQDGTFCEGSHVDFIMTNPVTTLTDIALGVVHGKIIVARGIHSHEDCMAYNALEYHVTAFTYNADHKRCSAMIGRLAMSRVYQQKSHVKGRIFHKINGITKEDAYFVKQNQWSILDCLTDCRHSSDCYAVTFSLSGRQCFYFNASYTMVESDDYLSWFKASAENTALYSNPKNEYEPIDYLPYLQLHPPYATWKKTTPTTCIDACNLDYKCAAMTFDLSKFICSLHKHGFSANRSNTQMLSWFKIKDASLWNPAVDLNNTDDMFENYKWVTDSAKFASTDSPIFTRDRDVEKSNGPHVLMDLHLVVSTFMLSVILFI